MRLAAQAANEMVAGRAVETAALVVSLRTFIRQVLDLDAVPADVAIPKQGPLRLAGGGSRAGRGERSGGTGGGRGVANAVMPQVLAVWACRMVLRMAQAGWIILPILNGASSNELARRPRIAVEAARALSVEGQLRVAS